MAIEFDFYLSPNATPEEHIYHPRVVSKATLESDEILKQINYCCSLTESDVVACLSQLKQILSEGLRDGRTVHIEGIGYFSTTLVSNAPETTPLTRAEHIEVKSVSYRPEKGLLKKLATATLVRVAVKKHSAPQTDAEIDARIAHHFTEQHTLTRREVEKICSLNRGTALKHINRLLDAGKLVSLTSRSMGVYGKG